MTSQEIRQQFLDFFKSKEHRIVPSAPVVPYDDPTLLFTNAGMNQFKDVFLGTGKRDYTRAADTQKCIRVSGKHNDLEEVGRDTYHHTFFEMLGNWSFGDYYKEEAIEWAWELLTEVWKLPKERLWATVYKTDHEAYELWKTKTDINPDHILYFEDKDNFWEMGDTGPCGPCSEIHISTGDDYNNPKLVNADSPECIEIWNLVFIQYIRDENGKLNELPHKHVDTGMGFERVCAVLQDKKSNYDTDCFMPLINKIAEVSGKKYEGESNEVAMRVIADHIRTLTYAIADGATPGNEGRGYVLRRLLRRAARYGRNIGLTDPFMYNLTDVLVKQMGDVFPEIVEKHDNIKRIIKAEEESFNATLDRGIELFDTIAAKTKEEGSKTVSGEDVFKLYDTFGFPLDLTAVMARESGLEIDEAKFNSLMAQQRERARKSTKEKISGAHAVEKDNIEIETIDNKPSEFTGYTEHVTEARVTGILVKDDLAYVVLNKTPFYVESGGQIGDTGVLVADGKEYSVIDLFKLDDKIVHVVEIGENFNLEPATVVTAKIDSARRWNIMRNHSVTHFLHKALREVLGTHVQQSGSLVSDERLRFDFTHFEKVSTEELVKIEDIVNEKIRENIPLQHHIATPFEEAKEMGALMFFGDKYGDYVNVVQFGDYSMEFCGGTHVTNAGLIGMFKIVSESSIASGVRRIEAVTGEGVYNYIKEQNNKITEANNTIHSLQEEKKKLEKELAIIQLKEKMGGLDSVLNSPEDVEGVALYKGKVDAGNMDELKSMGDELRNKMKSGVGVLITQIEEKVNIVCVVTDDLVKGKKLMAGKIVGDTAKILDGGGGGRPHMATAGGRDASKIDEALNALPEIIKKYNA